MRGLRQSLQPPCEGDTVYVVLSKGPQPVTVVSVKNLQVDVARSMLQLGGLELGEITYDASTEVDEGLIISQDPASGEVAPGTKVNVVVSNGPEDGAGTILTYSLTIPIPTVHDSGYLQIYQDSDCIFAENIDCRPGSHFLELEGSGTVHVTAYLDGEIIYDQDIMFGV